MIDPFFWFCDLMTGTPEPISTLCGAPARFVNSTWVLIKRLCLRAPLHADKPRGGHQGNDGIALEASVVLGDSGLTLTGAGDPGRLAVRGHHASLQTPARAAIPGRDLQPSPPPPLPPPPPLRPGLSPSLQARCQCY